MGRLRRRARSARRSDGAGPTLLVAPAKLTVSLRVVGRRPDGYHEIEAEMVSLDLADLLEVDPDGDGLEVVTGPHGLAQAPGDGPDNLVNRALAVAGRQAHVRLHKHIPVGGGLGGGSSDAAAILRWADCRELEVAATLGADVPFCVDGGRAMVRGLGERVSRLAYRPQSFVLLLPPFGVDTGAVYREWDDMAERGEPIRDVLFPGPTNDLTAPALAVEPRLGTWRDAFADATGALPVLAGSGSTWWVEGTPASLGIEGMASLRLEGEVGRLLAVRTVPAGWTGESEDEEAEVPGGDADGATGV